MRGPRANDHDEAPSPMVERLESVSVYADEWMSVRQDTVRYPDGAVGIYSVVDSRDVALTIPVQDGRFHLVQQYRHPVRTRCWEFPSGSFDTADAEPAAEAARELREETGLSAGLLTPLGTMNLLPSTSSHRCWAFLATELTPGTPQRDREEQDMQSAWFTRAEVEQMLRDGTLGDAKSAAAYALLLVRPGTPEE